MMRIESGELCPSCGAVPLMHEDAVEGRIECPNCGEMVIFVAEDGEDLDY